MLNPIRIREALKYIVSQGGSEDLEFLRNLETLVDKNVDAVNVASTILNDIVYMILKENKTIEEIIPSICAINPINDEVIQEIKDSEELSDSQLYELKNLVNEYSINKHIHSLVQKVSKKSNEVLNGKLLSPIELRKKFMSITEEMFDLVMTLDRNSKTDSIIISKETIDDVIKRVQEYMEFNKIVLPTGLTAFDIALDGGLHSSRLYTIAIKSGGGKSTVMLSLGQKIQEMLKEGTEIYDKILLSKAKDIQNPKLCVYYFTFENSIDESLERYYPAVIGRKAKNKLEFNSMIEEFREKYSRFDVDLQMIYRSSFSTSPINIIQTIDKDRVKGYIPVMIIVDYLGLMISSDDTSEKRLQLEKITAGLKDVAVYFNAPVITGVQIKKDSYGKEEIDDGDIKEASGIIDNSDVIIGAWQGQNIDVEGSVKQMIFKVAKQRNYKSNIKFTLGINFNTYSLFNLDYNKGKIPGTMSNGQPDPNRNRRVGDNPMAKVISNGPYGLL